MLNQLVILSFCLVSLTANAAFQLPEYKKITLKNGLTVYLMQQAEVPLVDVNIVVKSGSIHDGSSQGLSYLTAKSLSLGTASKTKAQIEQELDFIGANLNSYTNKDFSVVSASFASKDIDTMMPLIADVAQRPSFDESEYQKFKKRQLLLLEQDKESPKQVIGNYFEGLLFGDKGYGSPKAGTSESVAKIKVEDVKQFYQTTYQPNNAALVVVGDFELKPMSQRIKKLFSRWSNTHTLKLNQQRAEIPQHEAKVLLVDKSDAIETTFMIGGKGIDRSNKDYVGLSVINTILGGRFTSWLNDALRVNSGLTYGARSRFNAYSQTGTFYISTFTKSATTIEAVDLALETYQKLWQQGVDDKTLASAKAYVKGQFPPRYETSQQLSRLLAYMYGYGFDESFINTFEAQVDELDTNKAKALIAEYFPKENLQFVMIGKADDIREKVKKYGSVTEIDIKDSGFVAR